MERYFRLVRILSRGPVLLVFMALYLLFVLAVMPGLAGPEGSVPPIDLAFHYTVVEVYGWIEAYGPAGRQRYMMGEMTLDVVYPIIYTCLFVGLIGYFLGMNEPSGDQEESMAGWIQNLVLLPPVIFLFDMLENTGIVTMLSNYPEVLAEVAGLTAWATSIKWSFAALVIAVTLLLAIRKVVITIRHR